MTNRLDKEMHERGLTRSRSLAADLARRGMVRVNGKQAKPSLEVSTGDEILVDLPGGAPFASRAGEKLAHALDAFKIDPSGLACVDIGASTGGFTDCLLRAGASRVYAVDVGTDQLDPSLRSDPRVEVHEGTDIRSFALPSPVDLGVIDVSFISLEKVLPKAFELIRPGGRAIALVKPQFEVGKEIADRHKGVIIDEADRQTALSSARSAAERAGFKVLGETDSPIAGEKGNREFLVLLERPF